MKLALIFLVVAGLASYSNQQRLFRSDWMLNAPRRLPYIYFDSADTLMNSNVRQFFIIELLFIIKILEYLSYILGFLDCSRICCAAAIFRDVEVDHQ